MAAVTIVRVGWGIFIPSATKNRVTKKSRILITLAIDVDIIGERGYADAGNERSHLSGKSQPIGGAAHQKAPGKGRCQQQLRNLGDEGKKTRQCVSADGQRHENQSRAFYKGLQKGLETGIIKLRLQGEKNNRPNILTYENTESDPAGQGSQLEFVIEQLHDDQRTAERQGDGHVKPIEVATTRRKSHENRQANSHRRTEKKLTDAGDQHRPARAEQLF